MEVERLYLDANILILLGEGKDERASLLTELAGGFMEIGPVHSSALRYAAVLRAHYPTIKLPDAIHSSSAIGFGCSHFLTGDERIPDPIELHHTRWAITRGPSIVHMLRPDPDVLRNIIRTQPRRD